MKQLLLVGAVVAGMLLGAGAGHAQKPPETVTTGDPLCALLDPVDRLFALLNNIPCSGFVELYTLRLMQEQLNALPGYIAVPRLTDFLLALQALTGAPVPVDLSAAIDGVLQALGASSGTPLIGADVAAQLLAVVGALPVDPADPLAYNPAIIVAALNDAVAAPEPETIPAPASLPVLGAGVAMLGMIRRRCRAAPERSRAPGR